MYGRAPTIPRAFFGPAAEKGGALAISGNDRSPLVGWSRTLPRPEAERADHRLVCRKCGRTEDVRCVVGLPPRLDAASSASFVIDGAEIVFRGYCASCAAPGQESGQRIRD
jgi:hypothetical protein